jgi:hypothetical protein
VRRRGSTAIEFALTLPVIFVIMAGILEYGWYLFQLSSVVHAVRDGTRIGVTVPLEEGPETIASTHARNVLDGLGVPCGTSGCTVEASLIPVGDITIMQLQIEAPYEPVVGLLPYPSVLTAHFTMMMQEQSG